MLKVLTKNKKQTFPILHVITGPMFANKTDQLIKEIIFLQTEGKKVLVLKPNVDNRFGSNQIVSRTGKKLFALPIKNHYQIEKELKKTDYDVVAIDEFHFFEMQMIPFIDQLLDEGYTIWLSGLNKGFCNRNLEIMNQILSKADHIYKFNAECSVCKKLGTQIQAVDSYGNPVEMNQITNFVGDHEKYQTHCRLCFVKQKDLKNKHCNKKQNNNSVNFKLPRKPIAV